MVIAISDSLLSDYQGARNVMGGLLTPPSDYQAFSAPLSNKGNPTSKVNTTDNTFSVPSNTPVRLVDSSTGKVVYEGVGFDATQQAIAAAQGLTDSKGKKAAWQIQIAPGAGTTWSTVAQEKKNKSVLGKIADVALPVVGGILGGPLGAAAGSAASSVAQGRSLENTLLRAAIAGGTSALVPGGKSPVSAGAGTAGQAAGTAASQAATQAATQAAAQAGGDIIVNAVVPSLLNQAIAGGVGGLASTIIPSGGSTIAPDEIVVTAKQQPELNLGGTIGGITSAVTPSPTGPTVTDGGDIVVTAKDNQFLLPGVGAALATGIGATAIPGAGTPSTPTTPGKSGVLGTGLSATELATLGSLGISGLGSLFGGGGGVGTTTPYVSPFGAGPAIGGADFRVNPNITDYEQYGFGPEATFFRPEYNKLVASGAGMGGAPIGVTATTTTPAYTPLIGGGASGATGGTGATGATGATTVTTSTAPQVRPEGYTGVMPGQKVGDTQVVDGTTWVWGGFDKGWQMQYTNPQTKVTGVLPGNGATNVSSFANNPTVAVNQPYFAQNTANIPGWAETYRGFQQSLMNRGITGDAKAAAERELFTALETKPFESAIDFVDYARGVSAKYPAITPAASTISPMFTQLSDTPVPMINEPKYQTSNVVSGLI